MPYSAIDSALQAIGVNFDNDIDPSWTAVPDSDPVDVIVLAGSVNPPGAADLTNWLIELVNPVSGDMIGFTGQNAGEWPAFFDALPNLVQ